MKLSPLSLSALSLLAFGALPASGQSQTQGGEPSLRLSFPAACEPGRTCQIQHYVDRDPSPAARDYRCGSTTYDAHDGIDIRLPDMAAQRTGVAVLAAAAGQVLRVRDGVDDVSVKAAGAPSVQDRECGNGVVVQHAGGWQTQYCHMAKGSLRVKPGDSVAAGAPLGAIGLSGQTEFPHLHFGVRRNGKVVDPFAPEPGSAGTCGGGQGMWARAPTYNAGAVLNTGFAAAPVTMDGVEDGTAGRTPPDAGAPALIAYARAIDLRAGDVQEMVLRGPGGQIIAQTRSPPLQTSKDQMLLFIGRKRPPQGWPKGLYSATYSVTRAGAPAVTREFHLSL